MDTLLEACVTCASNPLRTILSILAISTAVSTLAIVSTGLEGFKNYASATNAKAFGTDTFVVAQVFPAQLSRKELVLKLERNPSVTRKDVSFVERFNKRGVIYSPITQQRADVVVGGEKFEGASVNGVHASMFKIRNLGLERGRFFIESEVLTASQVAVIGAEVMDKLFRNGDPIEKTIRIGGRGFKVIGLQTRQGTSGGVSLDRYVWIPLTAFERVFGTPQSLQVFSKADSITGTVAAEDQTRATMRARRQLRPGKENNFDILSPEAARSFQLVVSERISVAAWPISLAALLAAIVVVTNTSLVSVTQRTREIGIRRAIGATRKRIMAEVLSESTLLALTGGVFGLAVAQGLFVAGEALLSFELPITQRTFLWSLISAGLSGIVAGVYPAHRASRIEVINAIRVE